MFNNHPRVKYGRGKHLLQPLELQKFNIILRFGTVGINICYCHWNWELQKFKHSPLVKYCRGKLLLLPLKLGTAEVQTSSFC